MKIKEVFLNASVKLCLLGFLCLSGIAEANSVRIFTLSADEWARPRSGAVIPEMSPLRSAVRYWDKAANPVMLIRYPGEDSGEFWAAELRDWLISLGISADYIILVPGNQEADEIALVVGNRDEMEL